MQIVPKRKYTPTRTYATWMDVWKAIPREKYIGGTVQILQLDPKSVRNTHFRITIENIYIRAENVFALIDPKKYSTSKGRYKPADEETGKFLTTIVNETPGNGMSGTIIVDAPTETITAISGPLFFRVSMFPHDHRLPKKARDSWY